MASIFGDFKQAQVNGNGQLLAKTIEPIAPPEDSERLRSFYRFSNHARVSEDLRFTILQDRSMGVKLPKSEGNAWVDILSAFWTSVAEIIAVEDSKPGASWTKVFNAYRDVTNLIIRGYQSADFGAWTLPMLYTSGKYLRMFAIKADSSSKGQETVTFGNGFQDDNAGDQGDNGKLEEAARIMNRMFSLCLSDRSPIEDSRKWGIYSTTNLLFKTYFKINAISLCKNILRALQSQHDLPPLEAFPKSHVVTFKYYRGVIAFLDENYVEASSIMTIHIVALSADEYVDAFQAEEHLAEAWKLCHRDAHTNRQLILTYLIPCHLLTSHALPTSTLLVPYPRLEALFRPLCQCIKAGDLAGFDAAMSVGEDVFIKRRIYLTLERGRDIALRNLFRKLFIAGGFEEPKDGAAPVRRTRVLVNEFVAAMRLGLKTEPNRQLDRDEVECLLANLIYKNLMKGYIARERGIVVLSKGGSAFPGTGV